MGNPEYFRLRSSKDNAMSRRDNRKPPLGPAARRGRLLFALVVILSAILAACGAAETAGNSPTATSRTGSQPDPSEVIVIGNIDASNPARKIEEFQPLANYLAAHLEDAGIVAGTVLIARDTNEMARLLSEEDIDIYIDATIPTLEVCELSGCEYVLRQWKGGAPDLAGVFVTTEENGIESVADLAGKLIMLEQPHSTVGHILPLVTITQQGIKVRQVSSPQAEIADDEVGYYVSSGGQTSMNLLLNGEIDALAIGERAFEQFSADIQAQVVVFQRTVAAPAQLVSFRPGFDPALQQEIVDLLVGLEQSEEGQALLSQLRDTQKFEELPEGAEAELAELYETVKLAMQE
jgi:phosphonate transport system substrate-binding protein